MTRLTTLLLILTFLIPAPLLAQVASTTPVEPSLEAVITIPIYPYLEHSSTTAYGVFVATPWDEETVLWMYQPFDEPIPLEAITPYVDLIPTEYTSYIDTGQTGTSTPVAVIQNISYVYDANGNITQITDTSGTGAGKTVTYTYDDLNRLLTANTSAASSSPYTLTSPIAAAIPTVGKHTRHGSRVGAVT